MPILKKPWEIEIMAEAGAKLALILAILRKEVLPGRQTAELERAAVSLIKEAGAKPAFLGYRAAGNSRAYPFVLCVSINDTVVHGLPSKYVLREGDVVKLDLGLSLRGYCVDAAITVGAGMLDSKARNLVEATRLALDRGIREAKLRNTMGDIGHAIESHVERKKCSIVEFLVGHGIGKELHEEPVVWNKGRPGAGIALEEGMVLAIEPMVAEGRGQVIERQDGSFATKDGSRAAHFEHTVAITARGPRILTVQAPL